MACPFWCFHGNIQSTRLVPIGGSPTVRTSLTMGSTGDRAGASNGGGLKRTAEDELGDDSDLKKKVI